MSTAPATLEPPRARPTRRHFLRNLAAGLMLPGAGAFYASQVEAFWPEFHDVALPIVNLAAPLEGLRIAHLTDLHVCSGASHELSRGIVRHLNQLRPDLVVVTGDLVTLAMGWIDQAAGVLTALSAPVFVSFGNHDYGVQRHNGRHVETSDELTRLLSAGGCTVLRNQTTSISRGGARLWIAGLEDLWRGNFSPNIPQVAPEPVIALSHNPDTALTLDNFGVSWILSGHTHGGQIRIPGLGALLLPVQNRQFQAGMCQLPNSCLYVSRGIGYLLRARFACRPEVPIFTLCRR